VRQGLHQVPGPFSVLKPGPNTIQIRRLANEDP